MEGGATWWIAILVIMFLLFKLEYSCFDQAAVELEEANRRLREMTNNILVHPGAGVIKKRAASGRMKSTCNTTKLRYLRSFNVLPRYPPSVPNIPPASSEKSVPIKAAPIASSMIN